MPFVRELASKLRIARALGLDNVARVLAYRTLKSSGIAKALTAAPEIELGSDFFQARSAPTAAKLDPDLAIYFSRHRLPSNGHVVWHYDPFCDEDFEHPGRHWSELPDFVRPGRDIKVIWEQSRFDWALRLALEAQRRPDSAALSRLNGLIADWLQHNPPYRGPNWKCGQEAAIRMLQTLLAAFLIGEHDRPSNDLMHFVAMHCQRISPTLLYAIAQCNNHAISESVGLYLGSAWLAWHRPEDARARRWRQRGEACLERLVDKLIADDGSFSQYSLTYHRFVVDMLCQAEFWRRLLDLPRLSDRFYDKVRASVEWLFSLVDPTTGDGPNLGSNDGALLFCLTDADYRDFRPSVQLGAKLFLSGVIYPPGPHDDQLRLMGLDAEPRLERKRASKVFPSGGYVLMLAEQGIPPSWGLVRFPSYAFRPGHADALHFDLWVDGVNLLRDSGSYSYNPVPGAAPDLAATAAHNTIEFDGRDQMPKISRFLYGDWLRPSFVGALQTSDRGLSWTGAYRDNAGCQHERTVSCQGATWRIEDRFSGHRDQAVLRWRLPPQDWRLAGSRCTGPLARITITSDQAPRRVELRQGHESLYYLALSDIQVLEYEVPPGCTSATTIIELGRIN